MFKFKTEAELAEKLIAWLEKERWEIFKEVIYGHGYDRADIIAKRDGILWGIECKLTLNDSVLDQAYYLGHYTHLVSVAVPEPKSRNYRLSRVKNDFIRQNGIGLIYVDDHGDHRFNIDPKYSRTVNRRFWWLKDMKNLRDNKLTEYHKLVSASVNNGVYITDFLQTNIKIVDYIIKNGPCSVSEAMKGIDHHYSSNSSAYSGIGRAANFGYLKGIEYKNGLLNVKYGIYIGKDIFILV